MSGYFDLHLSNQIIPVRRILFIVDFYFHTFWLLGNGNWLECLIPFSTVYLTFFTSCSELKV